MRSIAGALTAGPTNFLYHEAIAESLSPDGFEPSFGRYTYETFQPYASMGLSSLLFAELPLGIYLYTQDILPPTFLYQLPIFLGSSALLLNKGVNDAKIVSEVKSKITKLEKTKPNVRKFHAFGPTKNESLDDFISELDRIKVI